MTMLKAQTPAWEFQEDTDHSLAEHGLLLAFMALSFMVSLGTLGLALAGRVAGLPPAFS